MITFLRSLLRHMVDTDASDIYLTDGITPMFRIEGMVQPYGEKVLSGIDTEAVADAIMNASGATAAFAVWRWIEGRRLPAAEVSGGAVESTSWRPRP